MSLIQRYFLSIFLLVVFWHCKKPENSVTPPRTTEVVSARQVTGKISVAGGGREDPDGFQSCSLPTSLPVSMRLLAHPSKYACGLKDRYLAVNFFSLGNTTIPAKTWQLTDCYVVSCKSKASYIFPSSFQSEGE